MTLTDDSRLMQIDVKINSQIITLLNVYLPYDNGTNLDEFQMYLSKVDSILTTNHCRESECTLGLHQTGAQVIIKKFQLK